MQISYEHFLGRQVCRQKVIMFTGHLNRKTPCWLSGRHSCRETSRINEFHGNRVFYESASVWHVRKAEYCTKVMTLVVKRLIHTLHELPCLILLLDGRWRLGHTSTYHFSFSDWLPPNSVWVNVSTPFCSSACLRAHRSRQAPRLMSALT